MRVAAAQVVVDLNCLFRSPMEVNSTITSDHRYPGSKRRSIAQRVKLLVGVQKNVLHEIIDFSPRHSSQQNAMHQWCIKIVETPESISIAVEDCPHEHDFD